MVGQRVGCDRPGNKANGLTKIPTLLWTEMEERILHRLYQTYVVLFYSLSIYA